MINTKQNANLELVAITSQSFFPKVVKDYCVISDTGQIYNGIIGLPQIQAWGSGPMQNKKTPVFIDSDGNYVSKKIVQSFVNGQSIRCYLNYIFDKNRINIDFKIRPLTYSFDGDFDNLITDDTL